MMQQLLYWLVLILQFLQQSSSMLSKNKYVSSLDLKYLDAKFIAIHDSQQDINTNLNQIRKSKATDLPSIHKPSHDFDDTTLYTSAILPQSRLSSLPSHLIGERYQSTDYAKQCSIADEAIEVNRYKKMIAKVKKDNDLLHRQITNLYTQERLGTKQPKKKHIRTILEVGKGLMGKSSSITRISPQAKHYERVYEDLARQDNPYRKQSLQIQKKFMNNNFHKNFESFLQAHNKRVPQFIKNIR